MLVWAEVRVVMVGDWKLEIGDGTLGAVAVVELFGVADGGLL